MSEYTHTRDEFERETKGHEMTIAALPPVHPAAALFPAMDDDEFGALRDSIREHGQQEACVLHEGAILDGRHRWRACTEVGLTPRSRAYAGECGSPTAFVLAMNMHRRHLSASQRAAVATDALPMFEAEARERQRIAGRSSAPGRPAEKDVQFVAPVSLKARDEAARAAGVNRQYVSDAKALKTDAPDLFDAVRAGQKTIPEAKKEARERSETAADTRFMQAIERRDTGGKIARARLVSTYSDVVHAFNDRLVPLNLEMLVGVFDEIDRAQAQRFTGNLREWADRMDAELRRGLRVVGGTGS